MRILITIASLLALNGFGQQLPVYSTYVHNPFVLNPAVTGYGMFTDFALQGKRQWTGYDDGPFNQILTVHSSINEKPLGVGGSVFNDRQGILNHSGFSTSTAYHLPVGAEAKLGVGVEGSFSFYSLKMDAIDVEDAGDPLLSSNPRSGIVPDLSVGMLLHRGDYMLGVSAQNILTRRADFTGYGLSNLMHVNIFGVLHTQLHDKLEMSPSIYVGLLDPFPAFIDGRITFNYQEKFIFETGYKSNQNLVIGAGIELAENLRFIYNYDWVLSSLRSFSDNSHEIALTYDFYYNPMYKGSKRRYKWIRRIPKPSLDKKLQDL